MRLDYKCTNGHVWEGWKDEKCCPICNTKDFKIVFKTSPVVMMNPISDRTLRKQGIIK